MKLRQGHPFRLRPICLAALAIVVLFVAETSDVQAAPPSADAEEISFARDIQPLLAEKCLLCHGADEQEAGLRLDSFDAATALLESGEHAIKPSDPKRSTLLARVTSHDKDERMPPKGDPFTADQIEKLREWIAGGAKYETHWAYRPLAAGKPPEAEHKSVRNDIDRFVLAQLLGDLEPSPTADRATLIKRLYCDLVGLLPTPEEVDAFVSDKSPDAYENLVDRLLASPRFGERWARHWLDKARYADSDGYEKDKSRPNAWRYRDWVIQAINDDMPLDQFAIEQLAGDLLPDASPTQRLATAFHRQTLTNSEGGVDREEFRVAAVHDRVETLGAVWLGLTVGCARCHNHKYDQMSQKEYYQLFAFFNNGEESNTKVPAPNDRSRDTYKKYLANLARLEARLAALRKQTPAKDHAKSQPLKQAVDEIARFKKSAPQPPMLNVRVISEKSRKTHIFNRGDFLQPTKEVQPATFATLPPLTSRHKDEAADRLDLARWLVDGRNPLPPRVVANQVFSHLFGRGLVPTMNDFGVRGQTPSQPALLDHLAAELIQRDWSRKSLIKYIVMSATYRQSSVHRADLARTDPLNRRLARQNRVRVEGELARDLSLAAAGLLSEKIGGPSVYPPLPPGVAAFAFANSFKWNESKGEDRYRRGMYTFFKRTSPHPNLLNFDCPDSNRTNVQRKRSNTPLQALQTLNNQTHHEAAQGLARRVLSESHANDEDRIARACRYCLVRKPEPAEVGELIKLLKTSRAYYAQHESDAKELVGSFVEEKNVDARENAAWIATVRILLNADEFLTRE